MKIIPNPAEDVNIPTAKQHNVTDSAKSGPNGNIPDGRGEEPGKRHSFSRTLAKEIQTQKRSVSAKAKHGAHEATVLKYLAHRVHASTKIRSCGKTFYMTVSELTTVFPYLGQTTLYEILLRLRDLGYLELHNFNHRAGDRTFWYHVSSKVHNAAENDVIYFNSSVATQVGVPAAIIYENFKYWVGEHRNNGDVETIAMSPTTLAGILPFSIDTIKRGLKELERQHIRKVSGSFPVYEIQKNNASSNPNECGAYPNDRGANPNECGAYPNDVTPYVTIDNPLEESSKGEPAAPSSQHSSCPEKEHEPVDSGHDENLPSADEQQREEYGHDTAPVVQHKAPSPSCAPIFSSLAELHAHNEQLSSYVPHIQHTTDTIREKVLVVAARFLEQFDENTIDDWNLIADAEELFLAIVPSYTSFIVDDLKNLDPKGRVFAMVSGGTLECIIGAFMWKKCHTGYTHGIQALQGTSYDLWLPISEVLENLRLRLVEEEFDQRKIDYASRDEDMEHDTYLTPAEKARVFRNGVHSINQVGAIFYDQQHRTDFITMGPKALKLVQKLFEHNPDASPADLLTIMHKCVDAYVNQPPPRSKFKHGIRWNARTGAASLLLFAKNLKGIVKELEIFDCPIKTFLGDLHRKQPQEEPMALAA